MTIPWQALGARQAAFRTLTSMMPTGCVIVETGTVREAGNWAGDGQSTVVWDWIAGERGGHVWTVDVNPGGEVLVEQLGLRHVTALVGDSLRILPDLNPGPVDLLYLDSLDVDWQDCVPSALHHLRELQSARHLLAPGTIVAVDDNEGSVGKGRIVGLWMKQHGHEEILRGYVRAWRIGAVPGHGSGAVADQEPAGG